MLWSEFRRACPTGQAGVRGRQLVDDNTKRDSAVDESY
jgi:hypothetical protein